MPPLQSPRRRFASVLFLCIALAAPASSALAQNVFVSLGGKAKLPSVITIASPGHGWDFSAAAPVAGERWNRIKRPSAVDVTDPAVAPGASAPRMGIHELDTAGAIELVDASGAPTSVRLTIGVEIATLATDKTRAEPSVMSKSTAAVPVGLMDASWRVYLPGNCLRFEIEGLEPGRSFTLYFYGAATDPTTNTNGENDGARFTLAPANIARGNSGTTETVGGYGGSLYTYNPDGDRLALSPVGTTWARLPAISDAKGRITFQTSRNSNARQFMNGFQLVSEKK